MLVWAELPLLSGCFPRLGAGQIELAGVIMLVAGSTVYDVVHMEVLFSLFFSNVGCEAQFLLEPVCGAIQSTEKFGDFKYMVPSPVM